MTSDLKTRVLAAAARAPAMTRNQGRAVAAMLTIASLAIALAIFELSGGLSRERALSSTIKLADGWALVSAAITWIVVSRGRSSLVRSPFLLALTAALSPILLVAWMRQFDAPGAENHGEIACFGFTLAAAATPLASFLGIRAGAEPKSPSTLGAAAGAMSGAWANVVVLLWCPVTEAVHALVGHALPIAMLIAIGATVGSSTLAARS